MSEEQIRKKARDHVVLNEVSVQKINRWFSQIHTKKKIKITRKDFINWLIEKQPENLSASDLNAIIERFYDEEKFLRQLLREIKEARANGQSENLEVIVRQKRQEIKKYQEENEPEP